MARQTSDRPDSQAPHSAPAGSTRHLVAGVIAGLLFAIAPVADAGEIEKRAGWLSVLWGDPPAESGLDPHQRVVLSDDAGGSVELEIGSALARGAYRWHGQRVEATVEHQGAGAPFLVRSLRVLASSEPATRGAITGSQPWVSILCKFSDVSAEPENLAFFQGMYANSPGGLDHYWRELSYDAIDVVGSTAVNWVTLPNPQSFYVPTPGSGTSADLNQLFDDCTAAADPFVDFSGGGTPFVGINMMFNDLLDCCAWGGGRFATLDGVTKLWRVTWEPPWGYADEGVISHEMGHGFGLPHSNNWDGDTNPYDSPWDVMSAATSYAVNDPVYGNLGKHVHAYHKEMLGWIPPAERIDVSPNSSVTVVLDALAMPSTSDYRMAVIPIPGSSRFWTVESRIRIGGYDGDLAGDAVIISEVSLGRSEPIWAYDSDVPPANFGDNEGTMWRVGETFLDEANDISVEILAATAAGFQVRITSGDAGLIFTDGFESGDTTAWTP